MAEQRAAASRSKSKPRAAGKSRSAVKQAPTPALNKSAKLAPPGNGLPAEIAKLETPRDAVP